MNAPFLWIGAPLILAAVIALAQKPRTVAALGMVVALTLAGLAWFLPVDTILSIAGFSFKLNGSFALLGRSLTIETADQPVLALIYILLALWFFGAEAAGIARRLVPLGLAAAALLIAALAVEPFLYAALLIELAVLLTVPLLLPPDRAPGRGLLRYLVYQTLAMPLILFAGWLLVGVEASPGDLALAVQSGLLLGLGFALLLAVFPLYTWIAMLSEETSPYAAGFLLWLMPTITLIFALGFLDRYTWLRTAEALPGVLRAAGLLMIVTGGWWAAFQRHLHRLMGYGAIVETGLGLLALSLGGRGVPLIFLLILPRALNLAVWSLALSALGPGAETARFRSVQGLLRAYPYAAGALVLANLSTAGLPLLAGFPVRLALWESLAAVSPASAAWLGLGLFGLLTGALRALAVLAQAPSDAGWASRETWPQRILLGAGVLLLLVFGLFPQIAQPFLRTLPALFEHLGG